MKTRALVGLLLFVLMAPNVRAGSKAAAVDKPGDVLLEALSRWTTRAMQELRLKGAPAPFRAVLAVFDYESYSAQAQFGELVSEFSDRARPTRVQVVVGDDQVDSGRFRGRVPSAVARPRLVIDDVLPAMERDLWMATDRSYKAAIKRWQIKRSALAALGGEAPPPDWTPAPRVNSVIARTAWEIDRKELRELAKSASSRLRQIKGLRRGEVTARTLQGYYIMVNSEGTRLIQAEGYTVVRAYADHLRQDGVRISDHREWVVRTQKDLPSPAAIAAMVDSMGKNVMTRAGSESVDYYEGPVLFEGEAAVDFLRHLLPPELRGTPPAPDSRRTYRQRVREGARIGRRVLPAGWGVVDDPNRPKRGLAGGFTYDREGVRAQKVVLVKNGYVRDLLMTRVPRRELTRSNGHARGDVQGDWSAELSIWNVTPARSLSRRAMLKRAERARKAARQDRLLVVRRLGLWGGSKNPLPRPAEAVWRLSNGKEVPISSLEFQKVDRRTLRSIVAAGGRTQLRSYMAAGSRGSPAVIQAPGMLLVEDMEAIYPGADDRPSTYPPPPLNP
jgi:hypothetical protein